MFALLIACAGGGSAPEAGGASSATPAAAGSILAPIERNATTASHPCDPLARGAEPIALATVLGAGHAADGTVYVIDQVEPKGSFGQPRVFVSNGTLLQRRAVAGTGSSESTSVVSLGTGERQLQIKIESANGVATKMGIFHGALDSATKSFEIGVQGEQLTLLAPSDLVSFTVANVTDVYVMYDATTVDGHRFIAFSTNVDYDDTEVHVFYGTDDRLIERRVLNVNYDSSVHLTFDLDGVETLAQLQVPTSWSLESGGTKISLSPVAGSPGNNTNSYGEASDAGPTTPLPPAKEPSELTAGLTFICFS